MAATLSDEQSRRVWELEERPAWELSARSAADIFVDETPVREVPAIIHSSGMSLASYLPAGGPPERRGGVQARWWLQHEIDRGDPAIRVNGVRIDHRAYFPLLTEDLLEIGHRRLRFVERNVPPFEAEQAGWLDWSVYRESLDRTIGAFALDDAAAGAALRRFARTKSNVDAVAGAFQTALVRHPPIAVLVQPRNRAVAASMRSVSLRGLADLARAGRIDREATRVVIEPYLEDVMPGVHLAAEIALASTEEVPPLGTLQRAIATSLASEEGGMAAEAADAVLMIGAGAPAMLAEILATAEATARDASSSRRRRAAALVLGALRSLRETRRAERPLVALLRDPSALVRLSAVDALSSAPPAFLAEHLLPMLRDPSRDVVRIASRALLNGKAPGHLAALEKILSRDDLDWDRVRLLQLEIEAARRHSGAR